MAGMTTIVLWCAASVAVVLVGRLLVWIGDRFDLGD